MIRSFHSRDTELIFNLIPCRRFRNIEQVALRKLRMLDAAITLQDLRFPPGNHLEALSGIRQGQHSIRINSQWRICFVWQDGDAYDVEIVDYH